MLGLYFLKEDFTTHQIKLLPWRLIYSTLGDLYIAIGEQNTLDESKSWTTRIWFNPFTIWIWIGVLFLA